MSSIYYYSFKIAGWLEINKTTKNAELGEFSASPLKRTAMRADL
jgi:hypothetical protein